MLRTALILVCIALAVQGKTRRGPLPHLFWDKVKHLDVVDEPEEKIVGGTEVILLFDRKEMYTNHGQRITYMCILQKYFRIEDKSVTWKYIVMFSKN